MSDSGSDDNDCHSASSPCRNLQTVLDRAADGADIYVTSETLPINDKNCTVTIDIYYTPKNVTCCKVNSSLSYSIRRTNGGTFTVTCSGFYHLWLMRKLFFSLLSFITKKQHLRTFPIHTLPSLNISNSYA